MTANRRGSSAVRRPADRHIRDCCRARDNRKRMEGILRRRTRDRQETWRSGERRPYLWPVKSATRTKPGRWPDTSPQVGLRPDNPGRRSMQKRRRRSGTWVPVFATASNWREIPLRTTKRPRCRDPGDHGPKSVRQTNELTTISYNPVSRSQLPDSRRSTPNLESRRRLTRPAEVSSAWE